MTPEHLTPLSLDDSTQWDCACKMAETSRGMALEILAQSEPLGWGLDGVFWAACPNAKLTSGWANEFPARLLQFAFQNSSMRLSLCTVDRPLNASLVWTLRKEAKSNQAKQAQLDAFKTEKPCSEWIEHFNAEPIDSTFKPL